MVHVAMLLMAQLSAAEDLTARLETLRFHVDLCLICQPIKIIHRFSESALVSRKVNDLRIAMKCINQIILFNED